MKKKTFIEISICVLLGMFCQEFIGCTRDKSPLGLNASRNKLVHLIIINEEGELKMANGQPYLLASQKKTPSRTGWSPASDSVTTKSRDYLMRHFGESYFETYFEIRSSEAIPEQAVSPESSERYCVTFYHKISIADYVTFVLVATYHDSSGQIVRDEGVVSRVADPALGMPYAINDSMAATRALQEGLAPGIRPWRVSFYYYAGDLQRYVWGIIAWNAEYSGNVMIIDPATGFLLTASNWAMIP